MIGGVLGGVVPGEGFPRTASSATTAAASTTERKIDYLNSGSGTSNPKLCISFGVRGA